MLEYYLAEEGISVNLKTLISMNICACYYVTQYNDIRYVEQHGRKFVPEDHLRILPVITFSLKR